MTREVEHANPKPCLTCPWRRENQGKPHPLGWYTKSNLRRLWSRLRRGDSMTCHSTDPNVELPEDAKLVPTGVTTHVCAGALILQQRELTQIQTHVVLGGYFKRGARPYGLTHQGAVRLTEEYLLSRNPPPRLNLNEDVYYEPLGPWDPDEVSSKIKKARSQQ